MANFDGVSISNSHQAWKTLVVLFMASGFLSGCEETAKPTAAFDVPAQKYDKEVTLSGTVRDNKDAVTTGKIVATDDKGTVIASALLENTNRYSIVIPANTALPILLKAYPQEGEFKGKLLQVAIVGSSLKHFDINPLTTAIAEKAKSLGGYTQRNMVAATMMNVSTPDGDKTSAGFRGDPTKHYGGWH